MPQSMNQTPRVSSLYIYDNCAAAHSLCLKSGEEPATVYAFKGTRIHRVLAGEGSIEDLDADEQKIYEELWSKFREQLRAWRGDAEVEDAWTEHEFSLHYETSVILTGHPDKVIRSGRRLFIVDFKTSYHTLDALSATNAQLRGYVALADHNICNIDQITVWICKPGKVGPPAVYDRTAIDAATRWATRLVKKISGPASWKPTRGPWCQYCCGKVLCPLWREEIGQLAKADQFVESIPDQQLADLAPKLDIAKKVIERLKARLEERVRENPQAFPGWKFKPGRLMPEIPSVQSAYLAFKDLIDSDTFLKATNLGLGELVRIYRDASGVTWEQARKDVESRLGQNLTYTQAKSSVYFDPQAGELPEN